MALHKRCKTCDKRAVITSEKRIAKMIFKTLSCGHVEVKKELEVKDLTLISSDGKEPYKFQKEGAAFAIRAEGRVLIADEMGLGKTIQALLTAHSDPKEFTPLLVACKSGLKMQWMKEAYRWCGWILQVLDSEEEFLIPNIQGYIISFDLLWRFKNLQEWIDRINPRLIVLDEVQHIKNPESKRTKCIREISRKPDHVIGLSGTPIKNNAGEYFPILNILYPEKFPTKEGFLRRWTDSYWNGYSYKIGGLIDTKGFHEYTKDFIIRRTRKEVLPDLPDISRQPRFAELGDKVEKAYKETFKQFQDYYLHGEEESNFQRQSNILAFLSKMRHLTGIAKIEPCVEYVSDFIFETDRKIVIFLHHIDVAEEVCSRLEQRRVDWPSEFGKGVLRIESGMNSQQRNEAVEKFWSNDYRILIASTLASGEGLNLQCCSDFVMLERQWNPANEEQAEGRFPRPGQTADKINGAYFIAVGTVDEFFSELVEKKRQIVKSTMDNVEVKWDESSLIKELATILATKGGRKWGW